MVDTNVEIATLLGSILDRTAKALKLEARSELSELIERRVKISLADSMYVKCLGMPNPARIDRIFVPPRLTIRRRDNDHIQRIHQVSDLAGLIRRAISQSNDERYLLLHSGAGFGKTTTLRRTMIELSRNSSGTPLLFTLRSKNEIDDLERLVSLMGEIPDRTLTKHPPILLVDGYDEVSAQVQSRTADVIREFRSLGVGACVLGSRPYYNTNEFLASEVKILEFEGDSAREYLSRFADEAGLTIQPDEVVDRLESEGLSEFATHPLMLTLVALTYSKEEPIRRTPLRLLQRAFDVLASRWDLDRGILGRATDYPDIGSEYRIACLMRVAAKITELEFSADTLEEEVSSYLASVQASGVQVDLFVDEIAQWFGILDRTERGQWRFVHRCFHDYLAARYLVENGEFIPTRVRHWDTRAAYAACLKPDATQSLTCALRFSRNLAPVVDMLINKPAFDSHTVASAMLERSRRLTEERLMDEFEAIRDLMSESLKAELIQKARGFGTELESQILATIY